MAGVFILMTAGILEKQPAQIGLKLIEETQKLPEDRIPAVLERIDRLGEAAIPAYVRGITDERQIVFLHCRDRLRERFQKARRKPLAEAGEFYLLFSEEVLENIALFENNAEGCLADWTRAMLRDLARRDEETFPHRARIIHACERILASMPIRLAGAKAFPQQAPGERSRSDDEPLTTPLSGEPRIRSENITERTGLIRSIDREGKNRWTPGKRSDFLEEEERIDRFAHPRAEELDALRQATSSGDRPRSGMGRTNPRRPLENDTLYEGGHDFTAEQLAAVLPGHRPVIQRPGEEAASFIPAENKQKIAGEHPVRENDETCDLNIAERYIRENTSGQQRATSKTPSSMFSDRERPRLYAPPRTKPLNYAPVEKTPLGRSALETLPMLPSSDLMKLLHHTDDQYRRIARSVLIERDGFTETHLVLARKLFDPDVEVRRGIVSLLAETSAGRIDDWVAVLLDDPNPEVRYTAISRFATTPDRTLYALLLSKGRRDSDPRITALVQQIESLRKATRY